MKRDWKEVVSELPAAVARVNELLNELGCHEVSASVDVFERTNRPLWDLGRPYSWEDQQKKHPEIKIVGVGKTL